MRLHINPLSQAEFGAYRCVAKNSLGDTDGTIKLYSKYTLSAPDCSVSVSESLWSSTGIPPNAVNYVENFEARHKGK